ncbi:MAG: NAD(P)/FAD-dependent oxidoreductase [Burkholderiales bacterium]|nr:NAD(P)/FAD-dependent oxidoreductase [Burkholderiales bacterium]
MSSRNVDVLVVGLGPAGASAAAAAARAGCRVLAVDRRREPGRPVQCAEFVPTLVGIEVGDLARSVRQSIASMTTFVEDDAPDVHDNFPGRMLDRAAFDAALVAKAREAGADCAFGVGARTLAGDGEAVLTDARRVRAGVIVGADGPRSIVGRAIGQRNAALVETRQITVTLERPSQSTDIFLARDIPGGYGWLFPKLGLGNLGAGVEPEHKARLKSIVDRLHRDLAAAGRVGRDVLALTGGAIPVGGIVGPTGSLRDAIVLLAGDAAGLAHPVTGAGIAAAVHSGRLAGEAAARARAGDASAAPEYEEELRDVFEAALTRAVLRRRELAQALASGVPDGKAALRRGWIGYPQYWARA